MVDYLSRRDALRKILIDKAESAVFFDAVSIRYLSGFSGSNAALLIGQDQEIDVLLTDSRYTQRAKDESPDIEVQIDREFNKQIHKHLDSKSIKKIAIDSTRMNIAQGEALSNKNTFELVKIKELLAPLRSVKDDYEIKQIKKACAITADT
jgi:Xaa-Pro dipeptidase